MCFLGNWTSIWYWTNASTNFHFELFFFPLLFILFCSFNLNILTFFLKAV